MTDVLLVPIAIEGLVVNTEVVARKPFLRWRARYDALDSMNDPIPDPFQNFEKPERGIHLRWRLPRALTRGVSNPQTQVVDFPCIPNRWLIVRLGAPTPAGGTTRRPSKAWIVESDYLGNDGSNSFATPSGSGFKATRIGRCYELHAATSHLTAANDGPGFLTAVGAGDVAFTTYQPDVQNVLSFHDAMTEADPDATLTYLVTGWYSSPGDDPLKDVRTPADLVAQLDARRWTAQLPAGVLPNKTIVHGTLQQVQWQQSLPDRADPDVKKMTVAVGYTAVDALAALVAKLAATKGGADPEKVEQWMQAFQYDLFDVLDEHGTARLEQKIRDGWFSSRPGGTMWSLVPLTTGDPGTTPPSPNEDQRKWLADLNRRQQQADDTRRLLQSKQAELYEIWWKKARITGMTAAERNNQTRQYNIAIDDLKAKLANALDPNNAFGLLKQVADLKAQLASLAATLPDPANQQSIRDYDAKMPAPLGVLQLKPGTEPPFVAPVDPVALVAGVTPPPGTLDVNEKLPCRGTSQTLRSVTSGGTTFTTDTGSIRDVMPKVDDVTKLPDFVAAAVTPLLVEAFFIDPSNAPAIGSSGAGWTDRPRLDALAAAMSAQRAALNPSFAFSAWKQAWSPLYLVWQMKWFAPAGAPTGPTGTSSFRKAGMDTFAFDPSRWTFDGSDDVRSRGSEYYTWSGAAPVEQLPYVGRSVLTPQATTSFLDRVKKYADLHPDDRTVGRIEQLIEEIGGKRFLSQSLTLNRPLVARRHLHTRAPADIASLLGNEYETSPDVAAGDRRPCVAPPCDTKVFFWPYRGGFFTFETLWLVDAFGQYLDLIEANGNDQGTAVTFNPIRGRGLVPDRNAVFDRPGRYINQAPRVVQPSRLQLRYVDAGDDSRDLGLSANANPICGWIVHNFLDRSLAFYSPAGYPIGDLVQSGTPAQPDVTWIPTPPVANSPVPELNAHAKAFRDELLKRSDRGVAFKALMKSIDDRIGAIDPGHDPGDPDLAVLVGRPLALVRVRVALQLFGEPLANSSWRSTPVSEKGWEPSLRQTANLTSLDVPIRLGREDLTNDGVIGYFDAGETAFNSVRRPAQPTPYIKPIGGGNYLMLNFGARSSITLTMLADPRVPMHATTGIFPTADVSLPSEFLDPALRRMAFTFRTGPILAARDSIRIPRPAEQNGDWLWLRRTNTNAADPCDARTIIESSEVPQLSETPRAIDGWLRFTPTKK